jgi:hypothetical protein
VFISNLSGNEFRQHYPWLAIKEQNDLITVNKFGRNPIIPQNVEVPIYDIGTSSTVSKPFYSSTAEIDTISSADNSDGQVIEIQGLDANWTLTVQNATLNGQTGVTLATPLIRVFRAKNEGTAVLAGACYIYPSRSTVATGVPSHTSNIRAKITSGYEQTQMACFSIPKGYVGYLVDWWANCDVRQAAYATISLWARDASSKVFQNKEEAGVTNGIEMHDYHSPQKFTAKSDIYMSAIPSVNNIAISGGFDIVLRKSE